MICEGGRMFDTHYKLHLKLAQLLASDAENVEKVVSNLETFVSQFKIFGSSEIICCHRNSKQNIIDICNFKLLLVLLRMNMPNAESGDHLPEDVQDPVI